MEKGWGRGEQKSGHHYSLSLLFPGENIGTQIFNSRKTFGKQPSQGSGVIKSYKSDMRGRDHMVGEESDDAVLSTITVQILSLIP